MQCKICLDNFKEEDLLNPCGCNGSVKFMCKNCLKEYIEKIGNSCKECKEIFKTTVLEKNKNIVDRTQCLLFIVFVCLFICEPP